MQPIYRRTIRLTDNGWPEPSSVKITIQLPSQVIKLGLYSITKSWMDELLFIHKQMAIWGGRFFDSMEKINLGRWSVLEWGYQKANHTNGRLHAHSSPPPHECKTYNSIKPITITCNVMRLAIW